MCDRVSECCKRGVTPYSLACIPLNVLLLGQRKLDEAVCRFVV